MRDENRKEGEERSKQTDRRTSNMISHLFSNLIRILHRTTQKFNGNKFQRREGRKQFECPVVNELEVNLLQAKPNGRTR